ncbi:hypothetical protein A3A25_03600 [Candidatus Azambacteria bacterium RIFCSPLOWO2_01_FULL_46_26]|uniref:Uncharacterized protein n=2 Tax=Candidatus Azamiibacteriota TaxID=1752741 RepID=A0A1F5C5Z1_9BACT|nr:MAG: hypothetical protein A2W60_00985 [Candidatus Azambacteria bacterium RIFCSPHIGHO2_02_46_12]OGD38249.1 MAG: hypothetical protein A3A25_03600 [Candidatus Azambacteria bacterium RIFCSPLOWO2_01_FULL_46_26]
MDLISAILLASRPLTLAVFKETSTIEAKIAIMAITTNNSIKVKPLFFLKYFNIFVCFLCLFFVFLGFDLLSRLARPFAKQPLG